ncbi:MAG TPA: TrmH family RNA methyltransferase [Candidatus Fimadaptatus faecigallinarum]|uniref:TrmH family RNA methyltransferase n=1 Tax=Candidatus Fimadaptatus faecigallinarum TaxID=2840814 RepID=A0A9D1S4V2_9FIRM|nr:TrmH family RNA methyltransferase [Candidatus Fimadaptatus faecigallinarum]
MPKLEPYRKSLSYSYCLGVFPSLELLDARPEAVTRLITHPDGTRNAGVAKLRARCAELGIREEEAPRVLEREAHKQNCYAALVFNKYECRLRADANHVVLHNISDAGNLGTALRTLLGFGLTDVAVIRPATDAFEPHVPRASMGALFRHNLRYYDSFDEYRAEFPGHMLYPFMLDGARELDAVSHTRREPYALVFGNEASGLPAEFAQLGQSVVIPHSNRIDSLNLAVAVAIGAYAFTRPV